MVGQGGFAFHDTNMLVSAMRTAHVGGRPQCESPARVVSRCSGI